MEEGQRIAGSNNLLSKMFTFYYTNFIYANFQQIHMNTGEDVKQNRKPKRGMGIGDWGMGKGSPQFLETLLPKYSYIYVYIFYTKYI